MALPDGTKSLNVADKRYVEALEKIVIKQQAAIARLEQRVETALRIQR